MKPLPQKYTMGSDWSAGPVCCDCVLPEAGFMSILVFVISHTEEEARCSPYQPFVVGLKKLTL